MEWNVTHRRLALAALMSLTGTALAGPVTPVSVAARVVMMSDFHFDPYHDPAKFEALRLAPVTGWQAILSRPDSATQAADLAGLTKVCPVRGVDTPWALLESSLAAAREHSSDALFVTVSGDVLVHRFDCRFHAMAKGSSEAEESIFAAKTVAYVAGELHRVFGKTPVYLALGNNDTGCEDYHETPNGAFLRNVAQSLGSNVGFRSERRKLLKVFPAQGDYSVALPKPILRGRLIVLQDAFQGKSYAGCNGKPDAAPGTAQMAWLRAELAAAHRRHEQVWVMAHIPVGVNVYTTLRTQMDVCGGRPPDMFLRDSQFADTLAEFSADVRLAIFAHTHQDEMALIRRGGGHAVAVKMVASVTPINGNAPSFTAADVDVATAALKDYVVVKAENRTGGGSKWTESYRFSTTYHQPLYGAAEVGVLVDEFEKDKGGQTPDSLAYQKNFFVGGGVGALAIRLAWANYVCAMGHDMVDGYRQCACAAKP